MLVNKAELFVLTMLWFVAEDLDRFRGDKKALGFMSFYLFY